MATIIQKLEEINRNPSGSDVKQHLLTLDFAVDRILENIETEEVQTTFTAVWLEGGPIATRAQADLLADEEAQTFI